jgi:hypothetical protein
MISAVFPWWRRTKVPAPKQQYVQWAALGIGGQTTNESVDAQWTREIMAKLAAGRFFEIHTGS